MKPDQAHVLILGAYGLIGFGVTRHLIAQGYDVTGLGRDRDTAHRVLPKIDWVFHDVAQVENWGSVIDGFDVVVNCSGALQDGPDDDLETVHHHAIAALSAACARKDVHLVQISAVGAALDAGTAFMTSKAHGDAAIRDSRARFNILRPGLVLAPHAYGGTMLLRMLAAIPLVQPVALPDARMQTVSLEDVACAVEAAIKGQIPAGFVGDLVEPDSHSLRDIVAAKRAWLGFAPARYELRVPDWLTGWVSAIADGLGRLGWRSPLRSTAMQVLTDGVEGRASEAFPVRAMSETLATMPATVEDRLQARMSLLMPIIVATLSLFWLVSGLVGLLRPNVAAQVLQDVGWSYGAAVCSVVFWAVIDIAIGIGFAVRRWAKLACWAAIAVSLFYLAASTLFAPALWIDPLGPMVKVLPGIVLALVARASLDSR